MGKKKSPKSGNKVLTSIPHVDYAEVIRKIIRDRLDELGKTPYWLWRQVAPRMSKQSFYQYMGGRNDTNSENLFRMMKALGLELRPKNKT